MIVPIDETHIDKIYVCVLDTITTNGNSRIMKHSPSLQHISELAEQISFQKDKLHTYINMNVCNKRLIRLVKERSVRSF